MPGSSTRAAMPLWVGMLAAILGLAGCTRVPGYWSQGAAARHLDRSAQRWLGWRPAARAQGTTCISCHTALPYLLARDALLPAAQGAGSDTEPVTEARLLRSVRRRVQLGTALAPYYPKQAEAARGTESVLNALILTDQDRHHGAFSALTQQALAQMWSQQITSGSQAGSWPWIDFGNEPWEAPDSAYVGATLAALAIGRTPPAYRASAAAREGLQQLQGYLARDFDRQPLLTRIDLLWASGALPQLLTPAMKAPLLSEIWQAQRPDGGWNTAALMPDWKRRDGSRQPAGSDGYATGLAIVALQAAGVPPGDVRLQRAVAWLRAHQSRWSGGWSAQSLNRRHGWREFPGHFMDDAATAYAVMALTGSQRGDPAISRMACPGCAPALAAVAPVPARAPAAPP